MEAAEGGGGSSVDVLDGLVKYVWQRFSLASRTSLQ
jgi:hypothetical protein